MAKRREPLEDVPRSPYERGAGSVLDTVRAGDAAAPNVAPRGSEAAFELPPGAEALRDGDIAERIQKVREAIQNTEGAVRWLDRKGMMRLFGLDAIIGTLLPGVGDVLLGLAGFKIVYEGYKAGLPKWQLAKMIVNLGLDVAPDTLLSNIPFIGNVVGYGWDVIWRGHARNREIMQRYLTDLRKKAGMKDVMYPEEQKY